MTEKSATGKFLIPLIGTVLLILFTSPFIYKMVVRPLIVYEIREYKLPEIYIETIEKNSLNKIPRISIIEVKNSGNAVGDNLTLAFKTNNNTTIQGSESDLLNESVIKIDTQELKDGSSLLKVDAKKLRPNETILIKVLTDITANFYVKEKLIDSGKIVSIKKHEAIQNVRLVVLIFMILMVLMLLFPNQIIRVVSRLNSITINMNQQLVNDLQAMISGTRTYDKPEQNNESEDRTD